MQSYIEDYESSLFRLVRHVWREENCAKKMVVWNPEARNTTDEAKERLIV